MIMRASARGQARGSAEGSCARVKRQKWPPVAPGQAAGSGRSMGSIAYGFLQDQEFWRRSFFTETATRWDNSDFEGCAYHMSNQVFGGSPLGQIFMTLSHIPSFSQGAGSFSSSQRAAKVSRPPGAKSSQVKSSLYRNNRQPYGSLSNVLRKPAGEDGSRWRWRRGIH